MILIYVNDLPFVIKSLHCKLATFNIEAKFMLICVEIFKYESSWAHGSVYVWSNGDQGTEIFQYVGFCFAWTLCIWECWACDMYDETNTRSLEQSQMPIMHAFIFQVALPLTLDYPDMVWVDKDKGEVLFVRCVSSKLCACACISSALLSHIKKIDKS